MHKNVCIGIISKPIGIKGQVKVISYTESPDSLFKYKNLFLQGNKKIQFNNYKLIENNTFSAYIDGINNRNTSENYRLQKIYINSEELPKLNDNEYYYDDLVNSKVFDNNNNLLGSVKAVLNYGAGDFLEIILLNNKEATIPFNKDSILNVNLEKNTIIINENYLLL